MKYIRYTIGQSKINILTFNNMVASGGLEPPRE